MRVLFKVVVVVVKSEPLYYRRPILYILVLTNSTGNTGANQPTLRFDYKELQFKPKTTLLYIIKCTQAVKGQDI